MQGAKYKVSYYAGYYDTVSEAEASGTLKRSWVYETNEKGYIHIETSTPVSGDDVYKQDGVPVLPLGTVVIEEIEAPEGYNLPEPFGKPMSFIQKITSDGTAQTVHTYNTVKQDGRAAALRSDPHRCAARSNPTEPPLNEAPCINLIHTAAKKGRAAQLQRPFSFLPKMVKAELPLIANGECR